MKPTSRVMLVEWALPETSEHNFGKWADITMMTAISGKERTPADFAQLYRETGFELEQVVPTEGTFSIVVGRPVA